MVILAALTQPFRLMPEWGRQGPSVLSFEVMCALVVTTFDPEFVSSWAPASGCLFKRQKQRGGAGCCHIQSPTVWAHSSHTGCTLSMPLLPRAHPPIPPYWRLTYTMTPEVDTYFPLYCLLSHLSRSLICIRSICILPKEIILIVGREPFGDP